VYTVLTITSEQGVPLLERHVKRLGLRSREAVLKFTREAMPGVYRLTWTGAELLTQARGPSRLVENMPVRFVVSPYVTLRGRFAKPAPPNRYESVREAGIATLLTSEDGRELYESDSAALVAWNGALVLTPLEVPGVRSIAEEALVDALPHTRAPILRESDWPLLLINAVAGTCAIDVPGRAPFPASEREKIASALSRERS
jgi:hypothetical protein